MAVTIEVKGAKELIEKLTTLEQLKKVKQTIYDEGYNLQELLMEYPTNAHGPNASLRGNSDAAKRMRRGFFWHLKNGDISVPYGRTMRLSGSWGTVQSNDGWTVTVGNSMTAYNDWVQGPGQTTGHANSGWLTIDKAKEQNEAGIIERITAALEEEVADVG